jgi:hypothetical protein
MDSVKMQTDEKYKSRMVNLKENTSTKFSESIQLMLKQERQDIYIAA